MHGFRRPWFFLPALACLACACAGSVDGRSAATPARGAMYVLSPGQSAAVTSGDTLKFDRIDDSRCKTGVVCVWAGYIAVSFTLSNKTGTSNFILSDSMPGGAKSVAVQGLAFELVSIDPAAPAAANAPAPDYRVTVRVTSN